MTIEPGNVYCMDALDLCHAVADSGLQVDMILADLPYGTTACAWDEVIPFEPMWAAFKRVIKPRGAIVLTASQPFTTRLINSNFAWFRYEWIWSKSNGGGFLNANKLPLKRHENVLIFAEQGTVYNPQFTEGEPYRATSSAVGGFIASKGTEKDTALSGWITDSDGKRYPTTVLDYPNDLGLHPTQKPVALFDYLIRTYTREGDLVLDPTCGSGTTAVAARACKRRFIVGDTSEHYCDVTRERLRMPFEPRQVQRESDTSDLPLFRAASE